MAIVDVELVGGVELADVEIEVTVVVDVGEGGAGLPRGGTRDLGGGGDVFEFKGRGLAEELVGANLVDDVEIDEAVPIDVAGSDARADGAALKFGVFRRPHGAFVVGVFADETGLCRRNRGEVHLGAVTAARSERVSVNAVRSRGGAGKGESEKGDDEWSGGEQFHGSIFAGAADDENYRRSRRAASSDRSVVGIWQTKFSQI